MSMAEEEFRLNKQGKRLVHAFSTKSQLNLNLADRTYKLPPPWDLHLGLFPQSNLISSSKELLLKRKHRSELKWSELLFKC